MMLKNVKMPTAAGGGTNNRHSIRSALKRGFTIMELVIVIAVIAVLAAVLIPTFANLTQRANESADTQTVENLNTILRADETIDGEKPATMQEALEHALSGGYNVSALTPTSDGNSILWNQEDNRFVLADSETGEIIAKDDITTDTTATGYKYWAVVGGSDDLAVAEAKSFSRYYTSADVITDNAVSANAGVDVSALETAVDITYSKAASAQDVVINGNGGALTVNADTDTVSAYGVFSSVDGKAVADESLHIYAEVTGNISIAQGRLVIETGSSAAGVLVTGASVTIVVNDAANLGTIAAATDVSVELDNIVTNNTNTPTSEIISTTPVDTTIAGNFAGGLGTEASPYLIATAEQWLYLASQSNAAALASQGKYFSVLCDLDFENVSACVQLGYFSGHIDFNNNTIKNIQINRTQSPVIAFDAYAFLFGHIVGESEISNLNFVTESPSVDTGIKLVGYINENGRSAFDVLLDNITIEGVARYTDNNTGLFVYWAGDSNLTISNCSNYATIYNNSGYTGIFVGRAYTATTTKESHCKNIAFVNCVNYGMIVNTYSSGWASMLISNPSDIDDTFDITVSNCVNYGNIFAKNINLVTGNNIICDDTIVNNGMSATGSYSELTVVDGKFVVPVATGAVSYEMVFSFGGAAIGGGTASEVFSLTEDDLTSVDAYEWVDYSELKDEVITSTEKYGTTVLTCEGKYVFKETDGKMTKQPSVTVTAYSEDGDIVGIYVYAYPSN